MLAGKAYKVVVLLPLGVLFYTLLAIGKFFPINFEPTLSINTIVILTAVSFLFYSGIVTGKVFYRCIVYYFILALPLWFSIFSTQYPIYALEKLDGSLLFPFFVTFFISCLLTRYKMSELLKIFLIAYLFILVVTLVYKLQFGIMNRGVRYFLNGPIVFGWLSGLAAIFSLFLFYEEKAKSYLVIFFICLFAVFWTLSKGPIVAMFITLLYILFYRGVSLNALILLGLTVGFIISLSFLEIQQVQRVLLILDYANNADANYGSVGSRLELYSDSLRIIETNLISGVGLGNWQLFNDSSFIYPHNITLEILSELGLLLGGTLFLFFAFIYFQIEHIGRAYMLFFLIAMQFSGDMTYLYFLYGFPLSMLVVKK